MTTLKPDTLTAREFEKMAKEKRRRKKMNGELDRIREIIENWVHVIGKRRTEEYLGISIHNLKESEPPSVKYE